MFKLTLLFAVFCSCWASEPQLEPMCTSFRCRICTELSVMCGFEPHLPHLPPDISKRQENPNLKDEFCKRLVPFCDAKRSRRSAAEDKDDCINECMKITGDHARLMKCLDDCQTKIYGKQPGKFKGYDFIRFG